MNGIREMRDHSQYPPHFPEDFRRSWNDEAYSLKKSSDSSFSVSTNWTACIGSWNGFRGFSVRLAIIFCHLQTKHVWQPCCMFKLRVAYDTQAFGDNLNEED